MSEYKFVKMIPLIFCEKLIPFKHYGKEVPLGNLNLFLVNYNCLPFSKY